MNNSEYSENDSEAIDLRITNPFDFDSDEDIENSEMMVELATNDEDDNIRNNIECVSQSSFNSKLTLDPRYDNNSYHPIRNTISTRSSEQKIAVKGNMKKYVNKNKKKFEKQFSLASAHLANQGLGQNICEYDSNSQNSVVRFLWSEKVFGYPNSRGTLWGNYKQYVYNNHPLISIFTAHKWNPLGKVKRIIVFFCLLTVAISTSYIFIVTTYWRDLAICRDGCNRQTIHNSQGDEMVVCSGGVSDGMSYDEYTIKCHYYNPIFLSALCGAVIVPFGTLLKYLATCGCLQGRKYFKASRTGANCMCCLQYLGMGALGFCTVIGLMSALWTLYLSYESGVGYDIFVNLLLSKVWSFLEWFLYTGPFFAYYYPTDRRFFYDRLKVKMKRTKKAPFGTGPDSSNNLLPE